MKSVLAVCLGNICRSPMAEGVLRQVFAERSRLAQLNVDSAGTGSWHVGNPPDGRAQAAAAARGIDISAQRARQVSTADFSRFDIIIAMDVNNLKALKSLAPKGHEKRVVLFLDFAPQLGKRDIPDPWHGDEDGFDHALDLITAAAHGLADHMEAELG